MVRTEAAGLLIGLTILGTCTLPTSAAPDSIFSSVLPQLKRQTRIPIVLPKNIPSEFKNSIAAVILKEISTDSYTITLHNSPDCTANACFVGALYAEPATSSSTRGLQSLDAVSLQGGITGYFHPTVCGASCTPANVAWVRHGTLYSISLLMHPDDRRQKSVLIALANSALQQTFQPR